MSASLAFGHLVGLMAAMPEPSALCHNQVLLLWERSHGSTTFPPRSGRIEPLYSHLGDRAILQSEFYKQNDEKVALKACNLQRMKRGILNPSAVTTKPPLFLSPHTQCYIVGCLKNSQGCVADIYIQTFFFLIN